MIDNRTVWILGEGSWIAGKLKEAYPSYQYIPSSMITKKEDVVRALSITGFNDIIINCIGYTGTPNVDACEVNKYTCLLANTLIPFWLSEVSGKRKIVHLSTGCIFDGDKNFNENDEPNYIGSFYSKTKLLAEDAFNLEKDIIVRLRMPITLDNDPKNLITKLLKYDKLINEKNSVTFVPDLVGAIGALIDKNASGIFNVVNSPAVSHKEIMKTLGVEKQYMSLKELRKITIANRSNCILSNKKINKYFKMQNILDVLKKYKNMGVE
jgi:dTDP-4-dehydrorhamnose reductase